MKSIIQTTCTLLLLGTLQISCAQDLSHQKYYGGPKSKGNLGLIASGLSQEDRDEVLTRHPEAQFRTLSKSLGIYEFQGLSERDIQEISPEATIEKNDFYDLKTLKKSKEELFKEQIKLQSSSPRDFFSGCVQNQFLKLPEASLNSLRQKNEKYLQVNDSVQIKLESSLNKEEKGAEVAWFLMPPLGSETESQLIEDTSIEVTFDMAATYNVALLYKRNNFCNFDIYSLNPTLNEELLDLSTVEAFTSNKSDFYHHSITHQVEASSILAPQKDVVVAVCDTGVNYNHPALNENIWINEDEVIDGVDNDGNGYIDDVYGYDFFYGDNQPMDDNGHGTHVAGLIAGKEMGAASDVAKIIPLKVGSGEKIDHGSLIECISYAIDKEADIINLSLGGEGESKVLKFVLEKAHEEDILVLAASGNGDAQGNGFDIDERKVFPSSFELDNILSVGSCDEFGDLTKYSNFGEASVDVVAPGGYTNKEHPVDRQIFSAYLKNPKGIELQGLQGTSMATPITAGGAALFLSENAGATPQETIETFKTTGDYVPNLNGKIDSSSIVNFEFAINSHRKLF